MVSKQQRQIPEKLGRYRILKQLGEGGMGAVFLALDSELDRQVALKIPHIAEDDGSSVLERFYREARAAATLRHPNICPVFDIAEHQGIPFLTMAFIEGKSLSDFKRTKPITHRQSAILVRKLALALQEAHQRGIIHRDLKPANIMIDRRSEPIVMDFGLARRASDARLTQSGAMIGTPAYMPPEQISATAETMGPACDIYSLGVILFELLAGRLPFSGDAMAMLARILTDQPPKPSTFQADLDPALDAICLRAIAKKPEDRYPSMAVMAAELQDYLRGKPAAASPTPVMALPVATVRPDAEETQPNNDVRMSMLGGLRSMAQAGAQIGKPRPARATPAFKRKKRKRSLPTWALLSLAGGVIVVLVIVVVILMNTGGTPSISRSPVQGTPPKRGPAEKPPDPPVEHAGNQPEPAPDPPRSNPSIPTPVVNNDPTAGWVPLFNGKDLSGWHEVGCKDGWWVKDNELFVDRGPSDRQPGWLMTDTHYSDFDLRLEFSLSKLADSGVAFRCDPDGTHPLGQAEIQIVDEQDSEFNKTLDAQSYRRTGSLCPLAADRTVPSLDRDRWHTMTIQAMGRHLKVTVNGIVTVDTDLGRYVTEARKGVGRPGVWRQSGPIAIQKMGGSLGVVRFRNIVIKDLSRSVPAVARETFPPSSGWINLFTGNDLSGWMAPGGGPPDSIWSIRQGILSCAASPSKDKNIWTQARYGDFQLDLEYSTNGNSGVFIRADSPSAPLANRRTHTLEIQIDKPDPTLSANSCGAIWGVAAPRKMAALENTWNAMSITARGKLVAVVINGETVVDVDLDRWTQAGKNPGGSTNHFLIPLRDLRREGHIGLQSYGDAIQFRNLRIKPLSDYTAATPSPKSSSVSPADPSSPALQALQGQWTIIAEHWKGSDLAQAEVRKMAKTLSFQGDQLIFTRRANDGKTLTSTGRIRVDNNTIDFSGADYFGKSREFRGIYELNGDTLKLAYPNTNVGFLRPVAFTTTSGDDVLVLTARRKSIAQSEPSSTTQLLALRELPGSQNKSGPWLSPDGLSLYWADKQGEQHSIWRASRSAPGQPFKNATRIIGGHDPTFSSDLTELIRIDYDMQPQRGQKFALFSARKSSASDPNFPLPHRKLYEMKDLGFVAAPCLSADGLVLYAEQFGNPNLARNVRFRRPHRDALWGQPEAVPISGLAKGGLRFPFLSADGRFLFGNNDESPSGMVMLTSNDGGHSFGSPKPIEVPGNIVKGKFPRYCAATRELIFAESTTEKIADLFLLRNFDPAALQ